MVILVMGVSGSGKSTVGRALARTVNGHFHDADDYHSAANVAKMRGGEPLTDEDREAWLRALRASIDAWLLEDGTFVLACSALTAWIRDVLGADRKGVRLVYLNGPKELIAARMRDREHFMPAGLLDSQFALLEPPERALDLDISQTPEELVTRIISELQVT
ncbi:MAG: gluconokinase [Gemmatimonadota bacterium]|nr:gluconokinase [Gemmatimonadota bacterium]MDH3368448.1 gluconokinase [Gemmatimonadota bacterium]MDH3478254.1 gluconokinase [Gemmatimonadota bacterium]MDH3570221.1 gluconokinase [Gemmatimonadota bacterium]MDH5549803.1 gluconokinase [Gemmatimonadota bacterium]